MTLLQMLVKREEQAAEEGKVREEKIDTILQELYHERRNELVDIINRHAVQTTELQGVHERLLRWSQQQELKMKETFDKTLDAMSPVAITKAQSMLSSFELDLQRVLQRQSMAYQRKAEQDTSALSSSIRQAQGTVEEWFQSILVSAGSTAELFGVHQEHLRVASKHSEELGVNLLDVHEALSHVRSELEVSLESLQESRETSQETAAVISEAVLLLNATVLQQNQGRLSWDTALHWVSSLVGDSGQSEMTMIQWWLRRALAVYEISLREYYKELDQRVLTDVVHLY